MRKFEMNNRYCSPEYFGTWEVVYTTKTDVCLRRDEDLMLVPVASAHEWTATDLYGYCPWCKKLGVNRERRINGNDTCEDGHVYPSREALEKPR